MRKFKHKVLNRIATLDEYGDGYDVVSDKGCGANNMNKEVVESGTDREEVIESDWIEKAMDEELGGIGTLLRNLIKEAISKHLPRITDEMIEKIYRESEPDCSTKDFSKIIKQNLPKDLLANPE